MDNSGDNSGDINLISCVILNIDGSRKKQLSTRLFFVYLTDNTFIDTLKARFANQRQSGLLTFLLFMATVTATTTCTYSLPVLYTNAPPTLPTHSFYFRQSVCVTVDNATSTPQASSTIGFNPIIASSTNATTSDVKIYAYMSAGEVLTNLFLFVIILMLLTKYLFSALDRVKTKRTYLQYGGGDVEVREDN